MPFILVKGGPEKGKTYELGPQTITLGRDKNQTIQILDQGVSRAHAEIFKLGELFIIRDLGSTNGTFVNNAKIEEEVLKDGDEIFIGNTPMRYAETLPTDRASIDLGKDEALGAGAVELAVDTQFSSTPVPAELKVIDSQRLQVTYEIGRILTQEGDVQSQVTQALESLMKATEASQGYLLLVDQKENQIIPQCRVSRESDSSTSKLSRAIVKHVVRTRRPTLCSDATVDDRFTFSESIVFRRIRSVICVPLFSANQVNAVIYFHKPEGNSLTVEDLELISQAGLQISMAIETAGFQRKLRKGMDDAVRALIQTMEAFEPKGQGHATRVADYSQAIAMQMALSREEIYKVRLSALLHDIGKLSSQKFEESGISSSMDERHVYAGEKIVAVMEGGSELLPGVKYHHERADGSGYPYKIKNAETPVMARIIIVANQFENELHGEDGKPKVKDILKGMAGRAGEIFDADAVKALLLAHRKDILYKVPDIFSKE